MIPKKSAYLSGFKGADFVPVKLPPSLTRLAEAVTGARSLLASLMLVPTIRERSLASDGETGGGLHIDDLIVSASLCTTTHARANLNLYWHVFG